MAAENIPNSRKFLQEQDTEGGLQLDKFVDILKRRALVIVGVTVLTVTAAVAKSVTEKPTYQAKFELLTPPVTLETEIISTINPEALSSQSEAVGVGVLDDTKIKILTSPRVMEPIIVELQKTYPNISYREVKNNLNITPNDQGKTLTVRYTSNDPGKVSDVLDVVSEAYLRYSLEDRQSDITRGVDFVDAQLPAVRERVTDLETELESLRREANLIDPLLQGQQLSEQMAKFTSDQLELRVLIEQTVRLYQDVQQEVAQGGELASASALLESPRYQALLDQLLEVDNQLAEDLTLYLEDSPEIEVVRERRDNIRPLLEMEGLRVQEQVASVIRELDARDLALTRSIESLNSRTKTLSGVARDYNTIQRDLDIAASNLNEFLTKREALRIDAAQRQTPWEILIPHEYPQASETETGLNFLLGTILGLVLGSAIAIAIDRMSDKIYTVKELKQVVRMPVLGTIPHSQLLGPGETLVPKMLGSKEFSPYKQTYNQEQSRNFLEAFRRLANNIRLNNLDTRIGSLAVSSAVPNEGKSSVSFYLAHACASIGLRTLLVDTDLRHPTLHKLCNTSNENGLSNYLTGEVLLRDSMVNLTADENLFFMPSGPIPMDPAKVLSSKKMEEFHQQVAKTFDLVIFDTPPLLGFADAFIVIKKTEGLLLTARLGQVKFSQLEAVLDELYISQIPTIGIVANDAEAGVDESYRDYQHYYKNYKEFVAPEPLEPLEPESAVAATNGKGNTSKSWQKTLQNVWGKS